MTVHVLRVPTRELRRWNVPPQWCFGCRRRLGGVRIMHVPVDRMSYYGPHIEFRCDGCGKDRRAGFGCSMGADS